MFLFFYFAFVKFYWNVNGHQGIFLEGLDHCITAPAGTHKNLLIDGNEIGLFRSMTEKKEGPRHDLKLDRLSERAKVNIRITHCKFQHSFLQILPHIFYRCYYTISQVHNQNMCYITNAYLGWLYMCNCIILYYTIVYILCLSKSDGTMHIYWYHPPHNLTAHTWSCQIIMFSPLLI